MLSSINLNVSLSHKKYLKDYDAIFPKLGMLQRQLREKNIPVMIIAEGWAGTEKGRIMNQLMVGLDPRGYEYTSFLDLNEAYGDIPLLRPLWKKEPAQGRISVIETDWYRGVYEARFGKNKNKNIDIPAFYRDLNAFEKEFIESGVLMIKFFFHIDKKMQKKRLTRLMEDPATAWTISGNGWRENKNYDDYFMCTQEYIQNTSTPFTSWNIIPADDFDYAAHQMLHIFVAAAEAYLNNPPSFTRPVQFYASDTVRESIFGSLDYARSITKDIYKHKLKYLQHKLSQLMFEAIEYNVPVIVVFEGVDAAGKGGAIKRITQALLPRYYTVYPVGPATPEEKAHHFLWRFWKDFPRRAHVAIFDRSWYGRVLVERIEGFCTTEEWNRAYEEINDTEQHLTTWGAVIVKFYMQISKEEQLIRFEERQDTPEKQWKLTSEDWRNRDKWDEYETAASEMFDRTSTSYAPWKLIATDNKKFSRIEVLTTLTDAIEKRINEAKKQRKASKNKEDKE